jgi:FkbM family methyltransferase
VWDQVGCFAGRHMIVPKFYWSLKKRAVALQGQVPRVVDRIGFRWRLDPTDWLDLQLLIGRSYEVRQLEYLTHLCQQHSVRHFVDCGSNFGLYSIVLPSRVDSIERTDAFEPFGRVRERLLTNLKLNHLEDSTRVHACALSEKAGVGSLKIDPTSSGIAALSPSQQELDVRDFALQEEITCVRFDDYIEQPLFPMALKIDVEGHEISALKGMAETLSANPCVVQVETRTRNRESLIALMREYGYRKVSEINEDLYFLSSSLADH